jgi:hypothetical protein
MQNAMREYWLSPEDFKGIRPVHPASDQDVTEILTQSLTSQCTETLLRPSEDLWEAFKFRRRVSALYE